MSEKQTKGEFVTRYIWWFRIGFILLGVGLGYLYWLKIGCASGTCPITSRWQNTMIYGGILGYLFGDLILDFVKKIGVDKNKA